MKFDGGGGSGGAPADRGGSAVCGRCFGRVCGCVAGAKEESRRSSSALNRNEGRDREGKRKGVAAGGLAIGGRQAFEDHVWFEDRWMVASLCDE
jgi:hypothetical protein